MCVSKIPHWLIRKKRALLMTKKQLAIILLENSSFFHLDLLKVVVKITKYFPNGGLMVINLPWSKSNHLKQTKSSRHAESNRSVKLSSATQQIKTKSPRCLSGDLHHGL